MPFPFTPSELTLAMYNEIKAANRGEFADEEQNWALLTWIEGFMGTVQKAYDIVKDQPDVIINDEVTGAPKEVRKRPGYSMLVDPSTTPEGALGYLAQFVGLRLAAGLSAEDARAQIADGPNLKRGSIESIKFEAQRNLTGTKAVYFSERQGSAYAFALSTKRSETPETEWLIRQNLVTNPSGYPGGNTAGWVNHGLAATIGTGALPATESPIRDELIDAGFTTMLRIISDTHEDNAEYATNLVSGRTYLARVCGYLESLTASSLRFRISDAADVQKFINDTSVVNQWFSISREFVADSTGTWRFQMRQNGAGGMTANFILLVEDITDHIGFLEIGKMFDGNGAKRKWLGAVGSSISQWDRYTEIVDRLKRTQKPIGLVMNYSTIVGGDWATLLGTHATWGEVATDFTDWADVLSDPSQT